MMIIANVTSNPAFIHAAVIALKLFLDLLKCIEKMVCVLTVQMSGTCGILF